jgi:competence protein ComEC
MRVFSVIPTYSVAVNVLATPLVMILSLGGMISAAFALIFPLLGSAIAYVLGLPLQLLIGLVDWVYALPASSYAVGEISLMAMIAMYLLLIWGWLGRRRERSLLITGLIALLILVPVVYYRLTFTQVIVLATPSQPVVLIQSRGQTLLIDTHNPQITQYTLLPYLARQGVNDLQCWLQLSPQPRQSTGCDDPRQTVSVSQLRDRNFEPKPSQANPTPSSFSPSKIVFKEFSLQWLSLAPAVLEVQYQQDPPWWIVQANSSSIDGNAPNLTGSPAMIIGNPQSLQHLPLSQLEPKNVIAIANQLPSPLQNALGSPFTHWWLTGQSGAIQWQPQQGWQKQRKNDSDALIANI